VLPPNEQHTHLRLRVLFPQPATGAHQFSSINDAISLAVAGFPKFCQPTDYLFACGVCPTCDTLIPASGVTGNTSAVTNALDAMVEADQGAYWFDSVSSWLSACS
jgi:hypothetical protein